MSEPGKMARLRPDPGDDGRMVVAMSVVELRALIAEEIRAALQNCGAPMAEKDKLLTPEQAAEILGQSVRWVYRHASQWPFARRLSRKCLRFSEKGLRLYATARGR
jgi:hypothetical protein